MKNYNYKIIKYEIFPFDILVTYEQKYRELKKLLKSKLPKEYHNEIKLFKGIYDARTVMFSNGATCIRLLKINNGIIAHEVFHAVMFLFNRLNIKINIKNDELAAYTIQYIINKINAK